MSEDENTQQQKPEETGQADEQKPMNRAERRAMGKKGATPNVTGSRGPSVLGPQRANVARPPASHTRSSNRGK